MSTLWGPEIEIRETYQNLTAVLKEKEKWKSNGRSFREDHSHQSREASRILKGVRGFEAEP